MMENITERDLIGVLPLTLATPKYVPLRIDLSYAYLFCQVSHPSNLLLLRLLRIKEPPQKKTKIVCLPVSPFRVNPPFLSFLLVPVLPCIVSSDSPLAIDPAFKDLCLTFKEDDITSPIPPGSPASTLVSESALLPIAKLILSDDGTTVTDSDAGRLTRDYPQAYSDFYPSKAGCVYKTGPAWKVRTGPEQQGIVREARTVHRPDLQNTWVSILELIIQHLDSLAVRFTCINPLGWVNEGEKDPFCPFLLSIGVTPGSLAFKVAVAAAGSVKEVLATSGLAEVEVAFVEMVNKRSTGGPKLLPLDPIRHRVPDFRKPFSAALGLPIAPLATPYYEGTGALYFRLSSDSNDKRIALLTCAHVVRPPPAFPANTGMTRTNASQAKEYMVALGSGGYDRAVTGIMAEIASLTRSIELWNRQLTRLSGNPARHREVTIEVERATRTINHLNALHSDVTKFRSTPTSLRTVGWALHSSPIQAPAAPLGYTEDWGMLELDLKQIDISTVPGNKIYKIGRAHV